jgi:hypothetical protein
MDKTSNTRRWSASWGAIVHPLGRFIPTLLLNGEALTIRHHNRFRIEPEQQIAPGQKQ